MYSKEYQPSMIWKVIRASFHACLGSNEAITEHATYP